MRADAAFLGGEAISRRTVGRVLAGIFDRIVTVNAHLHRIANTQAVFPWIEADYLSAAPAIADTMCAAGYDRDMIIVGPDEESLPLVIDLARRLDLDFVVARKSRHGDKAVDIGFRTGACFPDVRFSWLTTSSHQEPS